MELQKPDFVVGAEAPDQDMWSQTNELFQLVGVALRQGLFFGIETRIPYAITSILRPILFNKPSRPLKEQIKFFADQSIAHGWIIARIAVIFKLLERGFMRLENKSKPEEWHTFVAGALAGYLIMARDKSYSSMKKQINMAIGIRTIFAIAAYLVRTNQMPGIPNTAAGYDKGTAIFYTLLWGFVMWHWRHQTALAPGEMNDAQVKQMNFIYNDGDIKSNWLGSNHFYWLLAMVAMQYA